jgi:CheY-like chemotaxis protein
MQRLDLHGVIQSAVDVVRPSLEAKEIALDITLDPQAKTIFGDPERLQQVLWNILSNAAKFTPKHGTVRIRLKENLSHVRISIADTGEGIPAEFLPFVFDRFSQAEAGITRATGGLGLGLAICKHLVELQGGRIFAESEGHGKGATFHIELPLQGKVQLVSSGEARPPVRAPSDRPIELPKLSGCHILSVDDDGNALLLIREILEMTGATVVTANSVEEALGILERVTPHVLIADLGIPHLSGFDLIARVRGSDRPELRQLPAIALTAYARSEDRALSLQGGFNVHLSKPIDPEKLLTTIEALIKR